MAMTTGRSLTSVARTATTLPTAALVRGSSSYSRVPRRQPSRVTKFVINGLHSLSILTTGMGIAAGAKTGGLYASANENILTHRAVYVVGGGAVGGAAGFIAGVNLMNTFVASAAITGGTFGYFMFGDSE